MPSSLDVKLPPGSVERQRQVHEAVYKLSHSQMELLRNARIEVIFSVRFLARAFKVHQLSAGLRFAPAARCIPAGIRAVRPDIQTVGDLKSLTYAELASAPNMGPAVTVLYFDTMTAFNLPTPAIEAHLENPRPSPDAEAEELATALGLP